MQINYLIKTLAIISCASLICYCSIKKSDQIKTKNEIKQTLNSKTKNELKDLILSESFQEYAGNCPCPYDIDEIGNICGRRSAYIRPGGESPICYRKDISDEMIKDYVQTKIDSLDTRILHKHTIAKHKPIKKKRDPYGGYYQFQEEERDGLIGQVDTYTGKFYPYPSFVQERYRSIDEYE